MEAEQNFSFKDSLWLWLASTILYFTFRLVSVSWKIKIVGQEKVDKVWSDGKRVCYAGWHGRFLPFLHTHRKENVRLLISLHRDGEMLSRVVRKLGFTTIRGSSTRGGRRAVAEMCNVIKKYDIALTPDGPKGPTREVQPGITYVSQRAEIPIVPVGVSAHSFWRFRSWDGFTVPKPFSKVVLMMGEPMWVQEKSQGNGLEEANLELQNKLNHLTDEADKYFNTN